MKTSNEIFAKKDLVTSYTFILINIDLNPKQLEVGRGENLNQCTFKLESHHFLIYSLLDLLWSVVSDVSARVKIGKYSIDDVKSML